MPKTATSRAIRPGGPPRGTKTRPTSSIKSWPTRIRRNSHSLRPAVAPHACEAASGFSNFMNRFLVSFDPKRIAHQFTDILIIGGGIAGLRAALEVPTNLEVLVVTKDNIRESNSTYAQGGIAGVMSPEDRFENHVEDTLTAGAGLCDRGVVEPGLREAPGQINDLIKLGTKFDLENGGLALTREGGHSHRRIVHALGDATGFEVMRAIIAKVRELPHVRMWDDTFTLDLLTHK